MKAIVMSFKTDEAMRDQLKRLAEKRDLPVSIIIREAIKKYLTEVE